MKHSHSWPRWQPPSPRQDTPASAAAARNSSPIRMAWTGRAPCGRRGKVKSEVMAPQQSTSRAKAELYFVGATGLAAPGRSPAPGRWHRPRRSRTCWGARTTRGALPPPPDRADEERPAREGAPSIGPILCVQSTHRRARFPPAVSRNPPARNVQGAHERRPGSCIPPPPMAPPCETRTPRAHPETEKPAWPLAYPNA